MALNLGGNARVFERDMRLEKRRSKRWGWSRETPFKRWLWKREDLNDHKDKGARSNLSGSKNGGMCALIGANFDYYYNLTCRCSRTDVQVKPVEGRTVTLWVSNYLTTRINNGVRNRRD